MAKSIKKQAGTERPYTFYEFKCIVERIAKEQGVECIDELDYFTADTDYNADTHKETERTVTDWDCQLYSDTHWGGSEGIYTCFYFRKWNREQQKYDHIDFATAKNLSSSDEDFVRMHIFAAKVSLIAGHYMVDHRDEFDWTGWNVGYVDGCKVVPYMICGSIESARKYAQGLQASGKRPIVRNNATRKLESLL